MSTHDLPLPARIGASIRRSRHVLCLVAGAMAASAATAATQSYQGIFQTDDEVFQVSFELLASGDVLSLRTYSWGGGVNGAGQSVAEGGFAPVVTVFPNATDPAVVLEQGSAHAAPDCGSPTDTRTGFCWDVVFAQPLPAGHYTLLLSQDFNLPGPSLADPFSMAGTGNYTAMFAAGSGDPDPRFYDLTGVRRDGHWALDISAASLVPEPGAWMALFAGLGVVLRRARRVAREGGMQ